MWGAVSWGVTLTGHPHVYHGHLAPVQSWLAVLLPEYSVLAIVAHDYRESRQVESCCDFPVIVASHGAD